MSKIVVLIHFKQGTNRSNNVGQHFRTVCPQVRQQSSNMAGKQICGNIPLQEVFLKIPSHCIVLKAVSKFEVFILTGLQMERKRSATSVVVALPLDLDA